MTGSRIPSKAAGTVGDIDAGKAAIDVRNATVRYRIPHERIPTFKEFTIRWLRGRLTFQDMLALSNVTVRIERGETVGIIGRNGAGKSTLLKVIARVLGPTEGTVAVRGRVAPLLELGAGFDPELSGRENIYLNGAILGRSRTQMNRAFDAIVDFAELRDFIDAPLRTYSTGMAARLGFAVATDVDPDILLIDEVLSVGDLGFQEKCHERIKAFRERGATMVLVSHSLVLVEQLCDRAIWLESGRVVADGPVHQVQEAYSTQSMPPMPRAATP